MLAPQMRRLSKYAVARRELSVEEQSARGKKTYERTDWPRGQSAAVATTAVPLASVYDVRRAMAASQLYPNVAHT